MSQLTICLLNYRRKENYTRIIPALASQSVRPRIFLWNNGEKFSGDEPFLGHVDWLVESTENRRCWPRWWMGSAAETDYVCSWDDDLLPLDDSLFQDVIAVYEELGLTGAVGPFGVEFDPNEPYQTCWHHKAGKMSGRLTEDDYREVALTAKREQQQLKRHLRQKRLRTIHHAVDMIKGRHLLLPRRQLDKVRMWEPATPEDDIVLCGSIAEGKAGCHTVLGLYQNRFEDLDTEEADMSAAISRQSDHYARRQHARKLYFPEL